MSRIHQLFKGVNVINVGIEFFKDDIRKQGAPVGPRSTGARRAAASPRSSPPSTGWPIRRSPRA